MNCSECGSALMMRAMRIVSFERAPWWLRLFGRGPVREVLHGYNAACATPNCGKLFRVDASGIRKLYAESAKPSVLPAEPERERREPIDTLRTPGMEWTRGQR